MPSSEACFRSRSTNAHSGTNACCGFLFFCIHSALPSLEVYRRCDAICVTTTILRAACKSRRQYPPPPHTPLSGLCTNCLAFSGIHFCSFPEFLCIIRGENELICSDLKQDQNTGFFHSSFFYQGWCEALPANERGEKKGETYFMLHRKEKKGFMCLSFFFFFSPLLYIHTILYLTSPLGPFCYRSMFRLRCELSMSVLWRL